MNSKTILLLLLFISISSSAVVQNRAKRQWGGGPGGWQQNSWNNRNNQAQINAQQRGYRCQTEGIDILGLKISEYDCTSSAQSSRASISQQSQQQPFSNN